MHNQYYWGAAFALAVILVGCKQAPPPPAPDTHDADVKAIRDLETAAVQAIAAKDLDKACAFYADDASLFMPDAHVFNGIEAIKTAFKPFFGKRLRRAVLTHIGDG
jgi:ketosteroid isomerase-like protein